MKRLWLASIALFAAVIAPGCVSDRVATAPEPDTAPPPATSTATPEAEPSAAAFAWAEVPLTDAVTGEEFRLSDFKGKPVLLHAFAAW